jgi:tetratricopeptide (TPR) repeat protein
MSRLVYILALLVLIIVVWAGCNSNYDNKIVDSYAELENGWREYGSDNYGSAILAFESSLNGEAPTDIIADSYNGLGWTYLSISQNIGVNGANIDNAISKFHKAIEKDQANADAMMGHAVALLLRRSTLEDYQEAIKLVDSALNGDSSRMYRHDYKSKADLHAFKSQCYYYLGEIGKAEIEADLSLSIESDNKTALSIKKLIY